MSVNIVIAQPSLAPPVQKEHVLSEGVGRGLIVHFLVMLARGIFVCRPALPVAVVQAVPNIPVAGRIRAIPVPRFVAGTAANRLQRVVLPVATESVAQGKPAQTARLTVGRAQPQPQPQDSQSVADAVIRMPVATQAGLIHQGFPAAQLGAQSVIVVTILVIFVRQGNTAVVVSVSAEQPRRREPHQQHPL